MNMEEHPTDAYKKAILVYLTTRAKDDAYLLNACKKENKTLDGCIDYIKSESKKQAVNGVACIPDSTVYEWAVHYVLEDGLNFENRKSAGKSAETSKSEDQNTIVVIQKKNDDENSGQLSLF